MNTFERIKDIASIKLQLIILVLFLGPITTIQAQETSPKSTLIETQADTDWQALTIAMSSMGTGYEKAVKNGILEMHRYEDSIFKKSSKLAKAFWDNYPQDARRDKALYRFFSVFAQPHFIADDIPDSRKQFLDSLPSGDMRNSVLEVMDYVARDQWLNTGDAMVASILNSNATLERKESAAFLLISREFLYNIKFVNLFREAKKKINVNYWGRYEIQYWQHIRLLLENHVNTYGTLEIASNRVQNILSLLKRYSPVASDAYWQYFSKTTGTNNPLSEQAGVKALHKIAVENATAIEALKEVDFTKPLNMAFTAMDGSKVDLSKMRGKVVLIDFWATYCGPCIKEMPHVRAMYDKYRDQGFEVIGIAADGDANRNRVLDILKKKGANWPQRLDQGSDVSVSLHSLYKITVLPTVWLLNKEGVIVDTSARGERLEPLIREHLGL